ncbi:Regulator of RpoS [Oligella ureolytica]
MGLSVCRTIAEAHGGKLEASAVAEHLPVEDLGGATFTLSLQLSLTLVASVSTVDTAPATFTGRICMKSDDSHLVFVIDDDDAFRRSLVFLLEELAWQVEAFSSAAEFLEAYPQPIVEASCILLDIRMPMMSGMELQLRLNDLGWTTPIIFITGHGDIEMAGNRP